MSLPVGCYLLHPPSPFITISQLKMQGSEKLFFRKNQPTRFLGFIGFWSLLGFSDFLFERAVGKLVG